MKITIPAGLTAKQIIKDCNNQTSKGTPVLWSISWYEKEAFYTKEKTRGGEYEIEPLAHKGKSWNECAEIGKEEGKEMRSFAELLYVLVEHEKQTGERLLDGYNYSWTSSRDSGGTLVFVGRFGSEGMKVGGDQPDYSGDLLGVCFSRMNIEPLNSEIVNEAEAFSRSVLARLEKVEKILAHHNLGV